MALTPNKLDKLRRYDSSEYAIKAMTMLWRNDKNNVIKELNEMENLEALSYRGFWFNDRRYCYTNGIIDVSPRELERKGIWKYIDSKIEYIKKAGNNETIY